MFAMRPAVATKILVDSSDTGLTQMGAAGERVGVDF